MKVETLVATIDQEDFSLVSKMNIQTDALIANQCRRTSTESFSMNGKAVTFLNTQDRGVGKNRNLLLQNASADICVLADDDMRFIDGYEKTVINAFEECPQADLLVFNLIEKIPRRFINRKIKRVGWTEYARYGAARIAFRRRKIIEAQIHFNLLFGGGAKFGSGEDTIFLKECMERGLKIYSMPYALAEIDQTAESTWFSGYDQKLFHDKGALYRCLHPVMWPVFALRYLLRKRDKIRGNMTLLQAAMYMWQGSVDYSSLTEA